VPRRLRQSGPWQAPINEDGVDEGVDPQTNPILQRASEQYMKQMSQSGRDAVNSAGRSPAGARSMASRGHGLFAGHGVATTSAEALASLRSTAKWSSLVSHYLAWARKGVTLAGRLLLSFASGAQPLSLRDERVVTSALLRDTAWIRIFPGLAARCLEQIGARLGEDLRAQDAGAQEGAEFVAVRRAANPRYACALAQWLPGSSMHSRPPPCAFTSLASALSFRQRCEAFTPLSGATSRDPGSWDVPEPTQPWAHDADSADGGVFSVPQMHAWIPSVQTLESPSPAEPSEPQLHAWIPPMQAYEGPGPAESSEWRRPDALAPMATMTMESLASYADVAGLGGLQTLDSLPDMLEPDNIFPATCDSLPDIVQIVGPPPGPMDRPPFPASHFSGPAHGSPNLFMPQAGLGGRSSCATGAEFQS